MDVRHEFGGIDLARNAGRADRDKQDGEAEPGAQSLGRDGAAVSRQGARNLFGREADDRAASSWARVKLVSGELDDGRRRTADTAGPGDRRG